MDTLRLLQDHGYLTIFFGLLLEVLGLPIPGELILLFFGALVYWGKLELWVAALVGLAAVPRHARVNSMYFSHGAVLPKVRSSFSGIRKVCPRLPNFRRPSSRDDWYCIHALPSLRNGRKPVLANRNSVPGNADGNQFNRAVTHIQHLGSAIAVLVVLTALIVFILRLRKRLKYGDPMKDFRSQLRG